LVDSVLELLGEVPTRITYSAAPEAADHDRDTTVPVTDAARFPGALGALPFGCGCEGLAGVVGDGLVGDDSTPSAPPHAAVSTAASTINDTPARFINSTPSTTSRVLEVNELHAADQSPDGASTVPRRFVGAIRGNSVTDLVNTHGIQHRFRGSPATACDEPEDGAYEFGGSHSDSSMRFLDTRRS